MQAPTCSASLRSATASTRFAQVPLVALQRLGAARDCPLHLVRLVPYFAGLGFATATFGIRREDTACHYRHARHVEAVTSSDAPAPLISAKVSADTA